MLAAVALGRVARRGTATGVRAFSAGLNFHLTETQEQMKETARAFARDVMIPQAEKCVAAEPRELHAALTQQRASRVSCRCRAAQAPNAPARQAVGRSAGFASAASFAACETHRNGAPRQMQLPRCLEDTCRRSNAREGATSC